MPRTLPVAWSWSTTKVSTEPQITHSVVEAFSSANAASVITERNLPRLVSLRYVARQLRHQLSRPFRFLLCGGKKSKVAGLPALQRVQASSSMLLTTTLYASVAPSRLSLGQTSHSFLRKKSLGVRRLSSSLDVVQAVSARAFPGWLCCTMRGPWRSSHPRGSCLLCVSMLVT